MIKLLASLLAVIDKVLGLWAERRWKQQGRRDAMQDMDDEIEQQIELGEDAVSVPDPERDERLRDRFDRSRTSQ